MKLLIMTLAMTPVFAKPMFAADAPPKIPFESDVHFLKLSYEFWNEVGKDGWELVSVATTPTANFTHLVYLKRGTALAERVGLLPPPRL